MIKQLIDEIKSFFFTVEEAVGQIGENHVETRVVTLIAGETQGGVGFGKPVRAVLSVSMKQGDMSQIGGYQYQQGRPNPDDVAIYIDNTPSRGSQVSFDVTVLV